MFFVSGNVVVVWFGIRMIMEFGQLIITLNYSEIRTEGENEKLQIAQSKLYLEVFVIYFGNPGRRSYIFALNMKRWLN